MQGMNKPVVDMSLCLGNVPLMLEKCRKVLDKKSFVKLKQRVSEAQGYLEVKEIFKEYVRIIV
ncbi:MAG: hypothetical protein J6I46_00990 [Ruminococcus sp.]|nr:hypothetical protein [Ruminococcus sp.]